MGSYLGLDTSPSLTPYATQGYIPWEGTVTPIVGTQLIASMGYATWGKLYTSFWYQSITMCETNKLYGLHIMGNS